MVEPYVACFVRLKIQKQNNKDHGPIYLETSNGPILIGNYSYVYIMKNKLGKPTDAEIRIPIYYQPYFPGADEVIINEGRRLGIVGKRLTVFKWEEVRGEGFDGFAEELRKQNQLQNLVDAIKAEAIVQKHVLPPEVLNFKLDEKLAEVKVNDDEHEVKVSGRRKRKDSTGKSDESVEE